jgi:predicted amidohydrolase
MKYKGAIIQHTYFPGDKSKNLDRIEKLLDECGRWGAQLVCLQEYALTGYPKAEWAETVPGPSVERLGKKCKEHGIYLVAGSMLEKDGRALYNTVPFVGPDGKLIGKYRKINILNWAPKKEVDAGLREGDEIVLFDTPLGKLGVLTGADLDACEPCRILALKGCDVLLVPHSCTGQWVDAHRYVAECRAWEGMFYVCAPNPCGTMRTPEGEYAYLGSSRILSPLGEILACAGEFSEGIAVTTIDLEYVRQVKAENQWKFRRFPKAYQFLGESMK